MVRPAFILAKHWVLGAAASCGLGLLSAGAFAAEQPPANKPVSVKPIEGKQDKLNEQIGKTAGSMKELLEDLEQNFELKMDGCEYIDGANQQLDGMSKKLLPQIMESLRRGRFEVAALDDARAGQTRVVRELQEMLRNLQREVAPAQAQSALQSAMDAQTEAHNIAVQTRAEMKGLEGKPENKLTPEEKSRLAVAAAKQKDAGDAISSAKRKLEDQRTALKETDPATARAIQQVIDDLNKGEVGRKSGESGDDIAGNKLRSGEEKQKDILATLQNAEGKLKKPGDGKMAELGRKLDMLTKARDLQKDAIDQTKNLDPKDEKGVGLAAKKQGEVSKTLGGLKNDDKGMAKTQAKSVDAQNKILGDKPHEGGFAQQSTLNDLNKFIAQTRREIADSQGKPSNTPPSDSQSADAEGKRGENENPQPNASTQKTDKNGPKSGEMGRFEYGKLHDINSIGWEVSLPPRDRAAVEQAFRSRTPAKYSRAIKLYYHNLATQKFEN
jgi:hypothetical protein